MSGADPEPGTPYRGVVRAVVREAVALLMVVIVIGLYLGSVVETPVTVALSENQITAVSLLFWTFAGAGGLLVFGFDTIERARELVSGE